jgi:diketogulonate reductase-like aldo/keto reductase
MSNSIVLNNGVRIPSIGLGVFQSAAEETTAAVATALTCGYRHIDTAAGYGNEREVEVVPAVNQIELHPNFQQPDHMPLISSCRGTK